MIFKHFTQILKKEEKANTSKIYQWFVPQVNNLRAYKRLKGALSPRTMHCI